MRGYQKLVVAVASVLALAASPVIATASVPASSARAVSVRPHSAASAVSVCTLYYNGKALGGRFFCGGPYYGGTDEYDFANGTIQLFVVGTDHAVWTIWSDSTRRYWSGWQSLFGYAISNVFGGGIRDPYIDVIGGDNKPWHNTRSPDGYWSGWYPGY